MKMVDINSTISQQSANVPIKRLRLSEWIENTTSNILPTRNHFKHKDTKIKNKWVGLPVAHDKSPSA